MQGRELRFSTTALRGVTLHALEWGAAPRPVAILLHGAGANVHWWNHIAPPLAEHFRVVGLDFRGHGDSDYPEIEAGAFERDLEALIEHLGAPEVSLVGHSLGGHIALHHAARHEGVRRVAAIEVSRGAVHRERRKIRLALAFRRAYPSREEAVARYRFVPPAPAAAESLRRAIAERSVLELPNGRYSFKFDPRWFNLPPSPAPDLSKLPCPCLIVRGAESPLLSAQGAAQLASEIPDSRVVEIPGCGHNAHLERPNAVLDALIEHLLP